MYGYAASKHIVPEGFNPARGIQRFPESGRERYLTGEELDRLGAALREGERTGLPWEVDEAKPGAKHAPRVEQRLTKLSPHAAAAIRTDKPIWPAAFEKVLPTRAFGRKAAHGIRSMTVETLAQIQPRHSPCPIRHVPSHPLSVPTL